MKKCLAMLLSASMVLSLAACASKNDSVESVTATESQTATVTEAVTEKDTAYTAGTYTATATGMKGDITVEVSFDATSILSVQVTDQSETYGLGQGMDTTPVEVLPGRIVEHQSVNVDTITGATITSNAILTAVADCINQAGGNSDAMEQISESYAYGDQSADVIIVGAGAAGLSAAITAAENGAQVIIVEKQGIVGGSTTRSGGKILAAGTKWQEAQGYEDSPELMLEYLMSFDRNNQMDEEKVKAFCDNSLENINWLADLGVNILNVEYIHSSLTPWRVHNVVGGGGQTSGHGGQIVVPLYDKAVEEGVQIFYNTTATELLLNEDGSVYGVTASTADGNSVTFTGGAVILASGGYCHNEEMLSVYNDFLPTNIYSSVPASNTGDGISMAEAIGAKNTVAGGLQLVYVSFTCGVGINEESGLIVDAKGNRVVNEYTYQSHVAQALADADSPVGYYIATSNDPYPTVQYGMTLDSTPHASSIEELATLIGMDADTLAATVARYNELCELGVDEDFEKPAEYMIPVEGETYYAIAMTPTSSLTFGGLDTTLQSEVLDTNDQIIPGLYAAGEVAFTGLFADEYPCCGMAIGSAVYFGRIAGVQAAAFASTK
jgi:flavocytochrome c